MGEFYFHSLHSSFISAPLLPRLPVLPRLVSGGERVHRCSQVRFTLILGNFSGHLGETHPCSAQGDFCPAGCPHPAAHRPRCPSRQLRTARPLQSILVPSRPLRCAHGLAGRQCPSQGVALINWQLKASALVFGNAVACECAVKGGPNKSHYSSLEKRSQIFLKKKRATSVHC